jgi:hypothetical protein
MHETDDGFELRITVTVALAEGETESPASAARASSRCVTAPRSIASGSSAL